MSDREPPTDPDDEHADETDPWDDLDGDGEQADPWDAVEEADNDGDDYASDSDRSAADRRDDPAVKEEPSDREPAPAAEEVFDEMGVDELDGEALWDELAAGETDADAFDPGEYADSAVGSEASTDRDQASASQSNTPSTRKPTAGRADSDGTEAVVDKRKYCQQCPYFSDPPAVECSHDGTTIVEVLFDGQFRLHDCPVVTDSGPDRTILNDEH